MQVFEPLSFFRTQKNSPFSAFPPQTRHEASCNLPKMLWHTQVMGVKDTYQLKTKIIDAMSSNQVQVPEQANHSRLTVNPISNSDWHQLPGIHQIIV